LLGRKGDELCIAGVQNFEPLLFSKLRVGVQLLPEKITSSDIRKIDKIADKDNNTEYYVTADNLL